MKTHLYAPRTFGPQNSVTQSISRTSRPASQEQETSQDQTSREGAPLLEVAPQVLNMQRTFGNQWVRDQIGQSRGGGKGAPVQRLMSAQGLIDLAGNVKKDIGFKNPFSKKQVTLWEKSSHYKAVLQALEAYHQQLGKSGKVNPLDNKLVTNKLKGLLGVIVTSVSSYLEEHQSEKEDKRDRNDAITLVGRQASAEMKVIDQIAATPSFNGQTWKAVVDQLQGVAAGLVELEDDIKSGALQKDQFHGTSSSLLEKFKGEMMTGSELEKRGIVTNSGEGDFYSRGGGGAKEFISTGEGAPGMGAAMSYAKAVTNFVDYNPALYTDYDLVADITKLNNIVKNWNDDLNKVKKDDIMGARREKSQFEGLLKKLMAEFEIRQKLPKEHPRRKGQPYSDSTYPLLFEFTSQNLDIRNPRPNISLQDDMEAHRALGGERAVYTPAIDFRVPGRLKRVYCPIDKVSTVQARLANILGHAKFTVLPFELITTYLPEATKEVEIRTLELMETQYAPMRRMVLHAYSTGMSQGEEVTGDSLTVAGQELEIIKAMSKGARTIPQIKEFTGMKREEEEFQMRLNNLMLKLGATKLEEVLEKAKEAGLLPDKY